PRLTKHGSQRRAPHLLGPPDPQHDLPAPPCITSASYTRRWATPMRPGAATASPPIPATTIPPRMSSQKWLPVASTENQTARGQSSQTALTGRDRTRSARPTPTISASAEWRLGIAAYWSLGKGRRPRP